MQVSIVSVGWPFGHGAQPVTSETKEQLFLSYVHPAQPGVLEHVVQHCAYPPVVVWLHEAFPTVPFQPPGMGVPSTFIAFLAFGHSAFLK
jgi:hypothetical protein